MNIKEIVSKIRLFLSQEQLTDVKTIDGAVLQFDGELTVGVEIFLVTEAEVVPAPDGEYQLEDGTNIMVVEGKVSEIEAPEMPIEAPAEEAPAEEAPAEIPVAASEVNLDELVSRIVNLEAENTEMKSILKDLAESFSSQALKDEVKMSMKKEDVKMSKIEKEEKPKFQANRDVVLENIFANMYKNK